MKKIVLFAAALMAGTASFAQLQKGNLLVGGSVGNIGATFQDDNSRFGIALNPTLGYFIQDRLALGATVELGFDIGEGDDQFNYGILPFARYYLTNDLAASSRAKLFLQAEAGISGVNVGDDNTNGFAFGGGIGADYFLTSNVAFEALLKVRGTGGFGDSNFALNPNLNLGFQIFLPSLSMKKLYNEEKSDQQRRRRDRQRAEDENED